MRLHSALTELEGKLREHEHDGLRWYQFEIFAGFADRIAHGVFTRQGGVSAAPYDGLNAGLTVGDDRLAVAENRRRVVAALPGHPMLITAHPVHGSDVVAIAADGHETDTDTRFVATKADAMHTRERGLGLFWAYADCTPILLFDPQHDAIALVHAGWRGTAAAVAIAAIQAMHDSYSTRPSDLHVGLGPTIGPCCYEVDDPIQAAFAAHPVARDHAVFTTTTLADAVGEIHTSLRLDLLASNLRQLLAVGIPASQIETFDLCTGCHLDLFYSHRKERGKTGRHAVVIARR